MQKIPPVLPGRFQKMAPPVTGAPYLMADDKTLQRIYSSMYEIKENDINEIINDFNALITPEHVRSINKNATFNNRR